LRAEKAVEACKAPCTEVPEHLDGTSRGVGGASHTPAVSFWRGEYHAFVENASGNNNNGQLSSNKGNGNGKGKGPKGKGKGPAVGGSSGSASESGAAAAPGPCLVVGYNMVGWCQLTPG